MKKNINLYKFLLPALVLFSQSCKKDYGDLNHATVDDFTANASAAQLNNLVSGTESGMRDGVTLYLDDVGVLGREHWRLSGSEPRYLSDMLGGGGSTLDGSSFYIANTWGSFYQVVKNCNLLIGSANNSKLINADERSGYLGFARTIKAYEFLLSLNLVDTSGIRIQVEDPKHLGPFVKKTDALNAILTLLDSARTDLSHAAIDFSLAGFTSFPADAAGITAFNRALAARVSAYRQDWAGTLTNLSASFFNLNGDFLTGVYHVFGTGSGDQLNGFFFPPDQTGEVRVVHPSFAADLEAGDDRIGKTIISQPASQGNLSGDRFVWVSTNSTAPIAIIRNEELILLYAEAQIQLDNFPDAVTALDKIRTAHHLAAYAGPSTRDALLTEMLNQRRYSLYGEGHRWIDIRRYNLLNTLPIDRPDDNIWSAFPLPVTETP